MSRDYLQKLFGFDGCVVVVIGGTGVLGGVLCDGLANAGANVVVAGRSAERGNERVRSIKQSGGIASFAAVDATKRESVQGLLETVVAAHGRVDGLVNSAGVNSPTPLFDIGEEEFHRIIDGNLFSTLLGCQLFGKHMVDGGGGSILNIGSVTSYRPLSRVFAYSASKAAVLNLTQNVAREFAPHGVRVNCLCPGFFPAEQNRKILDKSRIDAILNHTPMGRLGDAPELIGATLLLLSPTAGSFITGEAIYVDGGFTATTICTLWFDRAWSRSTLFHSAHASTYDMPQTIVIFGASGDLTHRKLIPALYQLARKGRLPAETRIVGFSRTKFTHEVWRANLRDTTAKQVGEDFDEGVWSTFSRSIFYHPGDIGEAKDFASLAEFLGEIEKSSVSTRIYYLATAPRFYESAVEQLGRSGLANENGGRRRVIIEKPFGTDLATAQRLNGAVHQVFRESQVYRIDHYLGKETVQNLLVLRFANTIFEPIWNRNYIDHVQITVAEEVEVGSRAGYYDTAGVIRDMFQNHLLQLLMITAMEAPVRYDAKAVRDEKVKVLQAIRPLSGAQLHENILRGQYAGYGETPGVAPGSRTATFAAVKFWIDNWRWQGVPFYLRSGKVMSCRTTQIVVQFREPPHMLFSGGPHRTAESNRLVIQVQPAEGIQLHFQTKVPDAEMRLRQTDLDFSYQREFRGAIPEAYERLLLDALEGDASLFARADEVEAAWNTCDPILEAWQRGDDLPLHIYEPGAWGPVECTEWMIDQGRQWFDICPVLH